MEKTFTHLKKGLVVLSIIATPFLSCAQLKVSGLLFGDYAYKSNADSLIGKRKNTSEYNGLAQGYSGFNVRRAYLNFDYDVNSRVHIEAVLAHESTTPTGAQQVLPDNNAGVFLKYADLKIKNVWTGTDLILGQQRTIMWATQGGAEPIWQYRSIERTIADVRRVEGAVDLGVGLEGHYLDNNLGYNVLYGNNQGTKPLFLSNATQTGTLPVTSASTAPRIYGDVYYLFLNKHLEAQLYADYSQYNFNWDTTKHKFQTTSMTVQGFVAYMVPRFTVGVEAYQQTNTYAANKYNSETAASSPQGVSKTTASIGDLRSTTPLGLSLFAHAILIKDQDTAKTSRRVGNMQDGQKGGILTVFARYDFYNPDQNMTNAMAVNSVNKTKYQSNEIMILAGIDWQALKNVHFMPNIWYDGFLQKAPSDPKNSADIVERLTLFYQF